MYIYILVSIAIFPGCDIMIYIYEPPCQGVFFVWLLGVSSTSLVLFPNISETLHGAWEDYGNLQGSIWGPTKNIQGDLGLTVALISNPQCSFWWVAILKSTIACDFWCGSKWGKRLTPHWQSYIQCGACQLCLLFMNPMKAIAVCVSKTTVFGVMFTNLAIVNGGPTLQLYVIIAPVNKEHEKVNIPLGKLTQL